MMDTSSLKKSDRPLVHSLTHSFDGRPERQDKDFFGRGRGRG